MPPQATPPITHMPVPEQQKGGAGATVGVIIIIMLLILGALYFWGAKLNQQDQNPLPLIPGDSNSAS